MLLSTTVTTSDSVDGSDLTLTSEVVLNVPVEASEYCDMPVRLATIHISNMIKTVLLKMRITVFSLKNKQQVYYFMRQV